MLENYNLKYFSLITEEKVFENIADYIEVETLESNEVEIIEDENTHDNMAVKNN